MRMTNAQISAIQYAIEYIIDDGPKDIAARQAVEWDEGAAKWEQPFYLAHVAHIVALNALLADSTSK